MLAQFHEFSYPNFFVEVLPLAGDCGLEDEGFELQTVEVGAIEVAIFRDCARPPFHWPFLRRS